MYVQKYRIFLIDYKDFGLKKNEELYRLYLFKCFAYLPYLIINNTYNLLNKIDVTYELASELDIYDNNQLQKFYKFMNFLEKNKNEFNVTENDIRLMKCVLKNYFETDSIKNDITLIGNLLNFEKEKGENAYFEARLKYCNFYLYNFI